MQKMTVQEILQKGSGYAVSGIFLLTDKSLRPFRGKSGNFLQFNLKDKTGIVSCKIWNNAEAIDAKIERDNVVFAEGSTSLYEGNIQLIIERLEPCNNFVLEDLVEFSEHNLDEMLSDLKKIVTRHVTKNTLLSDIVEYFFSDQSMIRNFKICPGGVGSVHHAFFGGLLEHTLSVVETCLTLSNKYHRAGIRKDILMVGALFHDIGKMEAYQFDSVPKMTTRGRLLGHLPLGFALFRDILYSNCEGYPDKEIIKIEQDIGHLILSHHGKFEYETCRLPMCIEAIVLYNADKQDSDITRVDNITQGIEEGGWTPFDSLTKRLYYKG